MTADSAVRVLILDDDAMVGRLMVTQLTREGFECQFTEDAAEFLDVQRQWHPTHVIVDLVMSGTDGLEVLRRLAQDRCDAAVIIASGVSGRVMDAARRLADEEGLTVAGLLPKPYAREDLIALVTKTEQRVDQPGFTATQADLGEWASSDFANEFLIAIDEGRISVAYQPKVRCVDGEIIGYEALARWHDPTRGNIPPDLFVSRAETLGLVGHLTAAVAREALSWFAKQPGHERMALSINISAAELGDAGLDKRILGACEEYGVASDRVILELTETSAMDDAVRSLEILTRLRLAGFRLSLDDFGTGYSSMVQLARLPVTEIKVDRSFVMTASRSQESVVVIRTIIDLGHSLGLECTGEGVEDAGALSLLHDLGCDFAQGYFIARPMHAEQVADWLLARAAR